MAGTACWAFFLLLLLRFQLSGTGTHAGTGAYRAPTTIPKQKMAVVARPTMSLAKLLARDIKRKKQPSHTATHRKLATWVYRGMIAADRRWGMRNTARAVVAEC